MAEPSLALTFGDMILRVAEFLGISAYASSGAGAAGIPTDAHDLDLCERIVNDGYRRFCTSHRWQWMTPTFSITFDPDGTSDATIDDGTDQIPRAARYYLPDGFTGHFMTWFTYGRNGPRVRVDQVTEVHIRTLYAASGTTTGDPWLAAILPLRLDRSPAEFHRKWQVIFYPAPDSTETVTARARLFPNKLVSTNDRHIAGFQHDEAVLAACMAEADLQRRDGRHSKLDVFAETLAKSIAIDGDGTPTYAGYNADYSDGYPRAIRPYTGVDGYYSGGIHTGTLHSFN